jgi:glycosyltransferase involved in cell wall biosynthesis
VKPKIAFVMMAVSDLSGSGGAERHFSDLFDRYRSRPGARYDLFFVTDPRSHARLRSIGKLEAAERVIRLDLLGSVFRGETRIVTITWQLFRAILRHRFDLIHLTLPSYNYIPTLLALRLLPARRRPRVALNVVDCTLAHKVLGLENRRDVGYFVHRGYFRWTWIDGVFTWYQLFKDTAETRDLIRSRPAIVAAGHCCAGIEPIPLAEDKDRVVVFAGRMDAQKQPLTFVDAVARARELDPDAVAGWRFCMLGKGPLEPAVRERIRARGLRGIVEVAYTPDLAPVLARSSVFVSTQDYENFSSKAMIEAMALGNAVIARDVGQTGAYVRHGENGLLVKDNGPTALARALVEYLRSPEVHRAMQRESIRISEQEHTVEHCLDEVEEFWTTTLDRPRR